MPSAVSRSAMWLPMTNRPSPVKSAPGMSSEAEEGPP